MTLKEFRQRVTLWRVMVIRDALRALDAQDARVVRTITTVYMEPGQRTRSKWVRTGASTMEKKKYTIDDPPNPPPGPLKIRSGALRRTVRADKAVFTGDLRSGIIRKTYRSGSDSVLYGRIHEYGGMAGRGRSVRIPARPYMNPGVRDNVPILCAAFKAAIIKAGAKSFGKGA